MLSLLVVTLASSRTACAQTVKPDELCRRVKEIRTIPLKPGGPDADYSSVDPVYGQMRKMGKQVVSCLIEKITDVTAMNDPRQSPTVARVKIKGWAPLLFASDLPLRFKRFIENQSAA
jgi:hypothetical protein